jgi:hypothetical protein
MRRAVQKCLRRLAYSTFDDRERYLTSAATSRERTGELDRRKRNRERAADVAIILVNSAGKLLFSEDGLITLEQQVNERAAIAA